MLFSLRKYKNFICVYLSDYSSEYMYQIRIYRHILTDINLSSYHDIENDGWFIERGSSFYLLLETLQSATVGKSNSIGVKKVHTIANMSVFTSADFTGGKFISRLITSSYPTALASSRSSIQFLIVRRMARLHSAPVLTEKTQTVA